MGVKRVLQVFGSLNAGGAESRMMDVYRDIDRNHIQFDFVTMQSEKQVFEDEILELGGTVYKVNSIRKDGIIKHINSLRRIMKEKEYAAVHAHTSYHCGLVLLVAWIQGIPVRISHARTTKLTHSSLKERIMLSIGKLLIQLFATCKLAISIDAGEFLYLTKNYRVIPNSICMTKYINNTNAREYIRKKLKIPKENYVIGQIGRFDYGKNHKYTVDIFEQYLKIHNNASLLLVGDGILRNEIENVVKKKSIEHSVIFTGIRRDVPDLLHAMDVLLFPSIYEGLGGVVIEAQAAGIPVVESTGLPEENDLGMGIVIRCSLDESIDKWIGAIEKTKSISVPSIDKRKEVFDSTGYSLDRTISLLSDIYENGE